MISAWWLVLAAFLGAAFGVMSAALLVMSRRSDDEMEKIYDEMHSLEEMTTEILAVQNAESVPSFGIENSVNVNRQQVRDLLDYFSDDVTVISLSTVRSVHCDSEVVHARPYGDPDSSGALLGRTFIQ